MAAIARYVIFFLLIDSTVRIERVIQSARNLPLVHGSNHMEASD
jgi:hypothetical protein